MSNPRDDFDDLDERVMQAQAGIIAKLDAATDWDAVIADIYRQAAKNGTPEAAAAPPGRAGLRKAQTALDEICDHIDMLTTLLTAVSGPGEKDSPLFGSIYLGAASRSLQRLRTGLAKHRTGKAEALRLAGNAEHNLREADAALQSERGLTLDDAMHERIGDLMDIGTDITGQVQILRRKVAWLFDNAPDAAVLTPVPST